MIENGPPMTVREIARAQNISTTTVYRALRAGLLKGHRIGQRGDWRVVEEDLTRWLAEGAPTQKEQTHGT